MLIQKKITVNAEIKDITSFKKGIKHIHTGWPIKIV